MTRNDKIALWFVLAYLAIGLLTFGRSAADRYREGKAEYEQCLVERNKSAAVICIDDVKFNAGAAGLAAGLLWPFYWSWEVWSR